MCVCVCGWLRETEKKRECLREKECMYTYVYYDQLNVFFWIRALENIYVTE